MTLPSSGTLGLGNDNATNGIGYELSSSYGYHSQIGLACTLPERLVGQITYQAVNMGQFYGRSNALRGATLYTTSGCYTWYVPAGVSYVSVLMASTGAFACFYCCCGNYHFSGGGGGLGYRNGYAVSQGQALALHVPYLGYPAGNFTTTGDAWFLSWGTFRVNAASRCGGGYVGPLVSGGTGGAGRRGLYFRGAGGGGAGGYSGNGGNGGQSGFNYGSGTGYGLPGSGGAAGGGGQSTITNAGGGGGVGIYGQGGSGGASVSGGLAGSTGAGCGGSSGYGGTYGGGAGIGSSNALRCPGGGMVRIVYPGNSRQFPSCDVGLY